MYALFLPNKGSLYSAKDNCQVYICTLPSALLCALYPIGFVSLPNKFPANVLASMAREKAYLNEAPRSSAPLPSGCLQIWKGKMGCESLGQEIPVHSFIPFSLNA